MNWKDLDWKKYTKYAVIGSGGIAVATQLGKIIRGILVGIVLIVAAFFLTWSSVKSVKENSKTVENLELQNAKDIADTDRGLVKIYGEIVPEDTLSLSIDKCKDTYCYEKSETPTKLDDLIYYNVKFERLQIVEDKKTESDSNGTSRTTTEYTEKWVELEDKNQESWSELVIAEIPLNPDKAKIKIDKLSEEVSKVYLTGLAPVETYGQRVSAEVGDVRAQVSYIEKDDREYIVVGELRSNGITGGESFVITDKTNDELVSSLKSEENFSRWGMRVLAFIVLTIGLTSMLSPVLVFTDLIPLVGGAARSVATSVSAIISAIVVGLTVLLINYWYMFFIVMIIFVTLFIKRLMDGKDKDKSIERLEKV